LVEAKEEEAVVMGAGDGLGDGGQGAVDLAVEGEALLEDLDLQDLALVGAGEDGARGRQTVVGCTASCWRLAVMLRRRGRGLGRS